MTSLSDLELNWIAYLIGKIKEQELLPENRERLAGMRRECEEARARGEMPELKPFDGGIIL